MRLDTGLEAQGSGAPFTTQYVEAIRREARVVVVVSGVAGVVA
jgi:hypothetical protein